MTESSSPPKAQSDREASSTPFITFMLNCLKQAVNEIQKSNQKSNQKILDAMKDNPKVTIRELQEVTGLSESGVKKIIRQLKTDNAITRSGSDKNGIWIVNAE